MSISQRVDDIQDALDNKSLEQETVITKYQTPDKCVFCTDKNYDSIFYGVYRLAYEYKIKQDVPKQNKETCIHHTDEWLKHSLMSAGFMYSAISDYGKNKFTNEEISEIMRNKDQREKILNKEYDLVKEFSSAMSLYLPEPATEVNIKNRYNFAFTREDDIPIQNKIIRAKIKIYYEKAIEVLNNFES